MPSEQQKLITFEEMNRYDGIEKKWPSDEVYAPPKRTLANGWRKFHAARDCGRSKLHYVEHNGFRPTSERYEYKIRCWECGYEIPEEEILFIGGEWWNEHGWRSYGRTLEDLFIPPERVLELGPDPDEDELITALDTCRIERESGSLWQPFHTDTYRECDDCGHGVPILFDEKCRMCYDGPWTDRLQDDVKVHATRVREWANDSWGHKLEQYVDPLFIGDVVGQHSVLYRRHDMEGTTKLVIVTNRFEDMDDGHREYELWDPTYTERWQYREEDLANCFWDTGLYDKHHHGVGDDDIRDAYQHVCEHSFSEVHDPETMEPTAERCIHCKKRRPLSQNRTRSEDG